MLNIKFKTDKKLLARIIISKSYMPTSYANYLWNKYNSSYIFLQSNLESYKIDNNLISELQ